jgi:hypothetical protein
MLTPETIGWRTCTEVRPTPHRVALSCLSIIGLTSSAGQNSLDIRELVKDNWIIPGYFALTAFSTFLYLDRLRLTLDSGEKPKQ